MEHFKDVFKEGKADAALAASIFHLGRPQYFYRAILGFKTSWLSREIVAFGLFAKIAIVYSLCVQWSFIREWVGMILGGERVLDVLGMTVCLTGLTGVFCSVMVYRDTKRPFWDNHFTFYLYAHLFYKRQSLFANNK